MTEGQRHGRSRKPLPACGAVRPADTALYLFDWSSAAVLSRHLGRIARARNPVCSFTRRQPIFLQPIVELLVRRKVPRGIAIALIYFTFVLVVIVIALNTIPLISKQLSDLGSHLPLLVQQADRWIDQMAANKKYLPQSLRVAVESMLSQFQQGILEHRATCSN